jgi:hypothetical protein
MRFSRCLLFAVVTSLPLFAVAAESPTGVRLEMWKGCLCGSPDHSRTYDQLKTERDTRMLFGTNVAFTSVGAKLSPQAFLRSHLGDSNLKGEVDFYWKGVVYRRAADGKSYLVHSNGALRKFKMSDFKDGDLIVFYRESY